MRIAGRIVLGFVIGLAGVVLLGLLARNDTERQIELQGSVAHTHEVINHLDGVLATLLDAETGQRGFVLTGDDRYLAPFNQARDRLSSVLESVGLLTRDNPAQQHHVEQLRALASAELMELGDTIRARRAGDQAGALAIIKSGRGLRLMEEARALIAEMQDIERHLLDERTHAASATARRTTMTVAIGAPLLMIALAIAVLLITAGMTERVRTQAREIGEQNDELRQQSEELLQQSEQLSQQSEELSQQNEELQAQSEEIQSLNLELGRREHLLHGLLDAARFTRAEEVALREVCGAARDMFGTIADAVVVYEMESNQLALRASAGLQSAGADPVPAEHRFAHLVIEQNRTASLNDVSLRPDLAVRSVAGQPAFKSVLAAPIRTGDRPFGAVAIYASAAQEWTSDQFRLADWLAAQCSLVLDILRMQHDLRRQAALIDLSPDAIIVRRADGTILLWSHGAETLYGWSKAEAVGQTTHALLRTRFPQPLTDINRTLRDTGGWSGELVHTARDGRELIVESRWLAERDDRGEVTNLLESNVDVTARRRDEVALRSNEEQLRVATMAADIGVWSWTPGTSHVTVSANWRRLFGIAPDAPVTFETWAAALHPDDRERAIRELNDASRERREFDTEYRVERPDGTIRWLVDRGRGWYDEAGQPIGMAGVNIDITARKRAEEALRASEARYAALFENLLDGFAYCRMIFEAGKPRDFVYVNVNHAFERLTGLRDVIGRRVTEVIPGIRESNPEIFEVYGRVVATGHPEEIETYLRPLDIWLSIAIYRPEPDHFVAVFDNITERKRALETLRETDRRKSEFLATLSHELRNPLAPIRYALELLRCEGDNGSPTHPKRVIERQMGHLVRLVDDLLDVTRIASNKIRLRRSRVDLAAIVQHAVEATAPDIEQANHSLVVSLPSEPLWVEADPDRIAQVLTNLLNNAARYTPQGGRLTLTAAAARDQVAISVSDTGIGLRPEDRDRVFEMFTQVGEPGQGGLGIGLALVKGLVELHGGTVDARSKGPGQGSEFVITLPRAARPAPRTAANSRTETRPGDGRRILVVDDNVDSADMLKTLLEIHGHDVRVANDGAAALAVIEEFEPDIGLFDIGLPGMSGYDLARRLRADGRNDGMYLIAVTGWGQEEDRQRARDSGFNAHLTKPADPEHLQRLIARASGSGPVNEG